MSIHNVILFSGGRTSGFMLRKLIDSYGEAIRGSIGWSVIFCNTGKERAETLDFVHRVETEWNIPIIWLEYHRVPARSIRPGVFPTERRNLNLSKLAESNENTHWFKRVDYESASRKGEPFDEMLSWASVLPNVASRICSTQLKLRTAMRYLFSIGVIEYAPYIGIRKDEEQRGTQILGSCDSFEHPKFPLIEQGIMESDVIRFWRGNKFDLKLQSYEGNCDLCFLKSKWKRMRLMLENPGMSDWWKNWERIKGKTTSSGGVFRQGESYEAIESQAIDQSRQTELFCFTNQDNDIPCSCAERGFGSEEE